MTIQEAIKSGKPFRRKGWSDEWPYFVYDKHHEVMLTDDDKKEELWDLSFKDITPDDWETKY